MAYQSASELTKMMLDFLKNGGNEVWRNNNIAIRGRAFIGKRGVPDIIGYNKKYGYFVAVEVKAIGDRASTDQMLFLKQLSMAGGCAMLCQQVRDQTIKITIYKDGENENWVFVNGELKK